MTEASPAPTAPPSRGFWRETWHRFRSERLAFAALCFIAAMGVAAVLAPFVAGTRPIVCSYKGRVYFPFLEYYFEGGQSGVFLQDGFLDSFPANLKKKDPSSWAVFPLLYVDAFRRVDADEREGQARDPSRGPPTLRNLLGTDDRGYDVLALVLYGSRTALLVGLLSMTIAAAIGVILGALAGYFGGIADLAISRAIELALSIPTIVLILALRSVIAQPNLFHLVAVIGLTRWETIARYTRAEFLRLREQDFVLAARALGSPWHRIIFRHILPNALAPVIVTLTFGIAQAILLESALSFLGFSAAGADASWGKTLSNWQSNRECWWLAVFPGLAIFLSVLAYNLIADGFQQATDPRQRN